MCRLLLVKNDFPDMENIIHNFKKQSYTPKYTPFLDQDIDANYHKDGIGFAFFCQKKWNVQKSTDMNFSFGIPSDCKYIIGHLRNKGNCTGNVSYENTHPFIFDPFVFCHNGKILDFLKNKDIITSFIDKKYIPEIKGETDSEYIFYLLLSFFDQTKNMMDAIEEFKSLMICQKIIFYGNFIIANEDKIWITRLSNDQNQSCSLYRDKKKLMISSEPLSESFELIPVQEITEINI